MENTVVGLREIRQAENPDRDEAPLSPEVWDLVVIGGGPAGCTAAIYGAQAGLSVLLAEKEAIGGQMLLTQSIANWPGQPTPIDGFTLAEQMRMQVQNAGAVIRYGEVTAVEADGPVKTLHLAQDTAPIRCRCVILASGASPKRLGLPGEEALIGRGLSFCASCDGRLYRGQAAAVIGGGSSAAYDAEYLSRVAEKVTLIHRRKEFRMPPAALQSLQNRPNVTILTPYTVTGYQTESAPVLHLTALELTHTETGEPLLLPCAGAFLAIGHTPRTDLFPDLEKTPDGAVLTDRRCRTNLPGIYAAGDCTPALAQIVTACASGASAVIGILEDT